jgi:hypothetical protein
VHSSCLIMISFACSPSTMCMCMTVSVFYRRKRWIFSQLPYPDWASSAARLIFSTKLLIARVRIIFDQSPATTHTYR